MRSTMPDFPLTIRHLFEHGRAMHADSEVVTATAEGTRRIGFEPLAERATRLASALRRLGVGEGDRVATFGWNSQEHQEAYFAVPCMGAVLHTLNIRLFPEQLAYIVEHADDKVLLVDASLAPLMALVARLPCVEHVIVYGEGDRSALTGALEYELLLAAEAATFDWPELDERDAAAMCYTSGTTGHPKGVLYSHRSTFLHALGICSGEALGLSERDRVLPVVPMFHGAAWGLPYACWLVGADLVLPSRFTQAERVARLIAGERVTLAAAVPTVWYDLLHLAGPAVDLSSLRLIMCGGAAVPRSLIEAYEQQHGVVMLQGWGLTETSPVASLAFAPKGVSSREATDYRATAGRVLGGVELRLVGFNGEVLPWDGESVGELQVRGPWVTGAYYQDPAPEKFDDGWLRTGDVGSIDARGFIRISDRAKDLIKSGGEWIPSLELEAALLTHPAVREVAVIAAPDERWGERPLACVALQPGATVDADELRAFLTERVARWWVPERFTFVDEVPRTGVGKHDKKLLRARHAEGALEVVAGGGERAGSPPTGPSPGQRT